MHLQTISSCRLTALQAAVQKSNTARLQTKELFPGCRRCKLDAWRAADALLYWRESLNQNAFAMMHNRATAAV